MRDLSTTGGSAHRSFGEGGAGNGSGEGVGLGRAQGRRTGGRLETAPIEAANSASSWRSANAGGPARPYVSWDRGTKRHAPVPVRPYLSRFNASLASADTPVPQAAAATEEDASG